MKKLITILAMFLIVLGINAKKHKVYVPLDRTGWQVKTDSEIDEGLFGGGFAIHAIDGDRWSYWHSSWDNRHGTGKITLPHNLIFDLQKTVRFDGFSIVPRWTQGGTTGYIKKYKLYGSSDPAVWERSASENLTNHEGWTLINDGKFSDKVEDEKKATFKKVQEYRYVKLLLTENHSEKDDYICVSEFNLLSSFDGVTVTYNYNLNGETHVEQVDQVIGQNFSLPKDFPYVTSLITNKNQIVAEDNDVVNVECTEHLPFKISESVDKAHWYMVDIHSEDDEEHPIFLWTTDYVRPYIKKIKGTDDQSMVDDPNFYWCFIGNVFDGFKIVNCALKKGLVNTMPAVSFEELEKASVWKLDESTRLKGATCFTVDGFNYLCQRIINGKLELRYRETVEGGSSCHFRPYEAPHYDEAILAEKYVNAFKADNEAMKNSGYVGTYGQATFDALANVKDIASISAFKASLPSRIISIVPGEYYRIKNYKRILVNGDSVTSNEDVVGKGGYIGSSFYEGYGGKCAPISCGTNTLDDAGTIWQFVETEEGSHRYYLLNLNAQSYMGTDENYVTIEHNGSFKKLSLQSEIKNAGAYIFDYVGEAKHIIHIEGKAGLNPGLFGLEYWNNGAGNAEEDYWYIAPATDLEVDLQQDSEADAAYWSSLYLPFDVELPKGLKAYQAAVPQNGMMTLTEVKETVPALNAVILRGNAAKYSLIIDKFSGKKLKENVLEGNLLDGTEVLGDNSRFMVLRATEGEVGMYKAPASMKLTHNRAYYKSDAAGGFRFDFGEITGVEKVKTESHLPTEVYDLSGRRISNPSKGCYIIDGQKVYMK